MLDPEEWLARHAVECRRFAARISPSACREHQRRAPEGCTDCERSTGETSDPKEHWEVRFGMAPSRKRR